ncbi:hypothetical protein O5541_03980 [Escherichia coli]|nr:hypothetical protein [Escherichia coli]
MLISLIGTPWMPQIENGILVLEDINEHRFPGRTYAVAALSCGNFCHVRRRLFSVALAAARPMIMTQVTTLESVYAFLRSRLSIPLITGLDFGHEPRTVTLPLGAQAMLTNTREGTQLTISGHPVLKM